MRVSLLPLAIAAVLVAAGLSDVTQYNVEWSTPTSEPGKTQGGAATYQGAMPLGNGALTALAWANVSTGGIGIFVGHQNAMSSWTELFKLGMIQLSLSPNPFSSGSYFSQTLDLSTGTVLVYAGGKSLETYAALISVWVDANSDSLYVDVAAGPSGSTFSLAVDVTSTRPATVWKYSVSFATCGSVQSDPDVFVDPVPAGLTLQPAPAQAQADTFRHASGAQRPLRQLYSKGVLSGDVLASFLPGSVITYHRNAPTDGLTINVTLNQQGLGSLVPTTPDYWQDNTFGMVIDSGSGPALARTSPASLASTAPSATFQLRVTALAVQTDTIQEWIADLAALVAVSTPLAARGLHDTWWNGFWARSYIDVNATAAPAAREASLFAAKYATASSVEVLPVSGASLWLRASSLSGAANGSLVSSWTDESQMGTTLTQSNATLQPVFQEDGLGAGQPAVLFDGERTFLQNSASKLPQDATIIAVLRDDGSTAGCCSGAVHFQGSNYGISTVQATGNVDDDDNNAASGVPIVVMLDYSGSGDTANLNVRGRTVVASIVYSGGSAELYIDGCSQLSSKPGSSSSQGVQLGTRDNYQNRYFKGAIGEVIVYPRALSSAELNTVHGYLTAAWPAMPPKKQCTAPNDAAYQLSQMYAVTRYTQAVQSRGTKWPIKFNGMAFIAAMGSNGEPDTRGWGPSNWWQNTRLPYGAMLTAGDFDTMQVILDYYANQEVFLSQRTPLYWGHPGMWTTETHHLSGAYDQSDYGCSRPSGYPVSLMTSGYLHLDQGGDSGTGEYPIMALDWLLWTNNSQTFVQEYLKIPIQAALYFVNHYQNMTSDGKIIVWPAQVLETWWCAWDAGVGFNNCCEDDAPSISAMTALLTRLLQLPAGMLTPTQTSQFSNFLKNRVPLLPLSPDGAVILPARVLSTGTHNSEGPELYPIHPHRMYTKGLEVATGLNITVAVSTYMTSGFANQNSGWNYGLNAAALLGLEAQASAQLLQRAATKPAEGYRFMGFAPHFQDFDPSADHFANMNRCLQDMLLQSGDDGFESTTIVLFPAWPCGWDVNFKLWGPLNTTVEVSYAGGKLVSLDVQPASRASAVKWANCVTA